MPFEWKEYFELAKSLNNYNIENGFSKEAILRCAISRIYYAAYWHAQDYAVANLKFEPKGGAGDHGKLRDALKKTKYRQVGYTLSDLYAWRETSDYTRETRNFDFVSNYNNAIRAAQKVYDLMKVTKPETTNENKT